MYLSLVVILLVFCLMISVWPGVATAGESSHVADRSVADKIVPDDDDLLLCVLQLEGNVLTGDLVTYMIPGGGLLLPLGEIGRLLELGISIDLPHGRAGGTVARQNESFALDMATGSVSVSGKPYRHDPALVVLMPDDIYVNVNK